MVMVMVALPTIICIAAIIIGPPRDWSWSWSPCPPQCDLSIYLSINLVFRPKETHILCSWEGIIWFDFAPIRFALPFRKYVCISPAHRELSGKKPAVIPRDPTHTHTPYVSEYHSLHKEQSPPPTRLTRYDRLCHAEEEDSRDRRRRRRGARRRSRRKNKKKKKKKNAQQDRLCHAEEEAEEGDGEEQEGEVEGQRRRTKKKKKKDKEEEEEEEEEEGEWT